MPTTPLEQKLRTLPPTPGVYIFKDAKNRVLYVGKAKLLTHRVRSYFQANATLDPAKQQMILRITDLDTITTDTEQEALILEANLIQQHQPPYNVILRDDKYYLFIKITREDYPRVYLTRRLQKDGSRYFGPYSSAQSVRATLKLLKRLFPHRGEKDKEKEIIFPHPLFTLSPSSLPAELEGEGKVEGVNKNTKYQTTIQNIIHFLQGDREDIIATLRAGMTEAAANKHYERAAVFRDQLRAIERLGEQQKVYLPSQESLDIISLTSEATMSAANLFSIRSGKLLSKNTFLLHHKSSTTALDILRQFIFQYYAVAQDIPPVIALPSPLPDSPTIAHWLGLPHLQFVHPQRGIKKDLITLGQKNARHLLLQERTNFFSGLRLKKALAELQAALHLPFPPHRIETYDISNIQGTLATGSMIVFIDGQPAPRHYKHFRIRTLTQPNDVAMLQEVLERRFSGRHEEWETPHLIIIDGGKGQLSAAQAILNKHRVTTPVIAIAKRFEEIFTRPAKPTGRSGVSKQFKSIRLPYDSDALYLIQRLRDEAHRFAITYHRALRSKQQKRSILDEIPSIGPKTKRLLLNHFGSLRAIRSATPKELEKIIGKKAHTLRDYL